MNNHKRFASLYFSDIKYGFWETPDFCYFFCRYVEISKDCCQVFVSFYFAFVHFERVYVNTEKRFGRGQLKTDRIFNIGQNALFGGYIRRWLL